jgi:hypothetical protein
LLDIEAFQGQKRVEAQAGNNDRSQEYDDDRSQEYDDLK